MAAAGAGIHARRFFVTDNHPQDKNNPTIGIDALRYSAYYDITGAN